MPGTNFSLAPVLGVAVSIVMLALAEGPRVLGLPTDADVIAGREGIARWSGVGLAVAAGLVAALALALLRSQRARAGTFGTAAAVVVAGLGVALLRFDTLNAQNAAVAAGIAVAAVALAPLLRERNLLTLTAVSFVVVLPVVHLRRGALDDAHAAMRRHAIVAPTLEAAHAAVVVVVAPDLPVAARRAIVVACARAGVAVHCVDADTPEAVLLARSNRAVLVQPGVADPPRTPPLDDPELPDVTFVWRPEVGPVGVVKSAHGAFTMRVVTPLGAVRQTVDDPRLGIVLIGAAQRELRERLDGVPADAHVLMRVEGPLGHATAWQSLAVQP